MVRDEYTRQLFTTVSNAMETRVQGAGMEDGAQADCCVHIDLGLPKPWGKHMA